MGRSSAIRCWGLRAIEGAQPTDGGTPGQGSGQRARLLGGCGVGHGPLHHHLQLGLGQQPPRIAPQFRAPELFGLETVENVVGLLVEGEFGQAQSLAALRHRIGG
ncbi:MAG: hypothetical protein ACK55I_10685, partial [bacterium]